MVRYKPKKTIVVPTFLNSVIQPIVKASTVADLVEALRNFDAPNHFEKPEERSLLNWYEILNKFDEVFETYVKQHKILKHIPKAISGGNPYDSGATSIIGSARGAAPFSLSSGPRGRLDPLRLSTRIESIVRRNSDRSASQGSNSPKKEETSPSTAVTEPITSELIVLVLKATYRVVRNASSETRNVYNSYDHLLTLVAETELTISMLALEVLQALLMRSQKSRDNRYGSRPIHSSGLIDRLRDIALGWGGREKGLGLVDCCSSVKDKALPEEGHSLLIEFKNKSKQDKDSDNSMKVEMASGSSSSKVRKPGDTKNITLTVAGDVTRIHILDVRELPHGEEWLMKEFCPKNKVPRNRMFSVLQSYRKAKAFGDGRVARLGMVCQQLVALTTLAQLYPYPKALMEIFDKESELISDIVTVAKADASYGLSDLPKSLRISAVRCLAGMTGERSRLNQISSAAGIGTHHGVFSSLLRAEISTVLSNDDPDKEEHRDRMDTDACVNIPAASVISPDTSTDVQMAEALLLLVLNIALHGGSSAASGLVASGVLGIIVPLLRDRVPSHNRLVSQAIRAINEIIQLTNSTVGSQAFRDHDGLAILAERIARETLGDVEKAKKMTDKEREEEDEAVEQEALKTRGETRQMYKDLLELPMTVERALEHQAPSSSAASRGRLPHSKWTLLRVLHQLFLHSLGMGGSQVRELVSNSSLPLALRQTLARPFHYGGGLFASATTAASKIAHSEPAATADLFKAGISKALVRSIAVGLPPHGEALKVIPNALAAICLASDARPDIVRASPLRPYVLRLATPFYSRALHGDIPASIGGALDEMMRHVPDLRDLGNAAIIELLKSAAAFVQLDINHLRDAAKSTDSGTPESKNQNGSARKSSGSTPSTEKPKNEKNTAVDSAPSNFTLLERMKLSVSHNAASMIGFSQGSIEHHKSIVTRKGLQELLKFRTAAALASPKAFTRDSHPSSRSSPTPSKAILSLAQALRTILSRHDRAVLSALFSAIREDAGKVLRLSTKLGDAWLPEEEGSDSISTSGSAKRTSGPKDGSSRKRSRTQSAPTDAEPVRSSSNKKTDTETRPPPRKSSKQTKEQIRTDLRNALCVLRLDVVLLGQMARGPSGGSSSSSMAAAWESQDGCSVVSLIAAVERLVRFHLAAVYTGLSCNSGNESDLCTASVTATKLPSMVPLSPNKVMDSVQELLSKTGVLAAKTSDITAAAKSFNVLPEKDSAPAIEVKGLAWAMETFAHASQKLYMAMARGLVYSSRRSNRDMSRFASPIRGVAATIGNLFVSHLKAVEPLWSRNVITITEGDVCAAWDYVRRIIAELKSILFCENYRTTQGLILRFFLSAGGAEALCNACRPLSLLKGSRAEFSAENVLNSEAYALNKKRFESFLKSNKINALYSAIILGKIQKMKKKTKTGKDADSDSVMNAVMGMTSGKKLTEKDLEGLENQVALVSTNVLHYRKQAVIQKVAANAWALLCSILQLISNCPGITNAPPSAMPSDPDSSLSEWYPKDVQRAAQFVAMKVLMEVTKEPTELLSAFGPSVSQTSDVISVILSILRTSSELSGSSDSYSTDNRPDSDDLEHRTPDDPQIQPRISPADVRTLVEMGFTEARAREALRQTYPPGGIEHAMEWILGHPEEEGQLGGDDSDDSSDDDDDDEEEDEEEIEDEDDAEDAENNDSVEMALAESVGEEPDVGDTEMTVEDENSVMHGVESAPEDPLEEEGPVIGMLDDDEVPELLSDDSIKPVTSGRKQSKNEASTKKADESHRYVDKDAGSLLSDALKRELVDVCASLSGIKVLTKGERSSIMSMISSLVGQSLNESDKKDKSMRGGERQKAMSTARSVGLDSYKSYKKALFESLIPVAMTAVKHEVENGSTSHASFVAVEILSILQKDKCLTPKVRLDFAKVITKELEKFLGSPQSTSSGMNSVVGIRVSFVWAHYGGYQARQALKSSGVADIAFRTLLEIGKTWDSLGDTGSVDEEATKPIKQLTIDDNGETPMDADEADPEPDVFDQSSARLKLPRKNQMQALSCLTTCFLILDAFVRFHARDSIIEHTENIRKAKPAGVMEVDVVGNKEEDTSAVAPPDGVTSNEMSSEKVESDTISKMDVVKEESGANPVDIGELTKKVKKRVEADQKKATDKVVDELNGIVGVESRKTPFPFSTSELLRCCIKLISSLRKFEVGDTLIALLQLVAALTADHSLAKQFMEEGGTELLLSLPHIENMKTKTTNTRMIRSLVRTILRHILEDEKTLTEAMEAEIRSSLQNSPNRSRQVVSTRSLVNNSTGMMNRNLECFTRALATSVRARGPGSGFDTSLQAAEYTPQPLEYWTEESKKRKNVVCVVENLVKLLVNLGQKTKKSSSASKDRAESPKRRRGVDSFALSMLSELVQLAPVIEAEFLQVEWPEKKTKGSALDFIVQELVSSPDPAPANEMIASPSMMETIQDREIVSENARSMIVALLSKTSNAYKPTVTAVREAARIESERKSPRGGVVKSLSQCITPIRKMRVLKQFIESNVANYLAKCLDNLDMSKEQNGDVANTVLKALSIIGQAAEQASNGTSSSSRSGNGGQDEELLMTQPRDMWTSLRDRDTMSPLAATGYMVL